MAASVENRKVPGTVWTSSYLSAGLAMLLVAELVGLGVYGYYRIQQLLDPENLANRVEAAVREHYPELRQELLTQIKAKSPEIAEQVSQEIIAATPEAREELERFTARQLRVGLDQVTAISAEQFRQLLHDNRETVVAAFEKLEAAPEEAHELILNTESNIEQQLGVDLQAQAKVALAVHRDLNEKLEHLSDAEATLAPRELIERRIVRILRTMQTEDEKPSRVTRLPGSSRK